MDLTNIGKERKQRKKPNTTDSNTMMYGKMPPQARDLEEAVLGAVMLEKNAFDVVIEMLKAESFYVDAHQRIFRAMQTLAQKSQPIDILTVVEELRRTEELEMVGGAYYVTKLTNTVVSAANIESHARIILQKFIQRELIRISGEIITDAYEDSTDVFELLDDAEGKLFEVTNQHLKSTIQPIDDVLVKTIQRIEEMRNRNEDITGVPSGFTNLDKLTYGWQNSDLIILAARPAVGKTAFALNLARNAAMYAARPTPVAVFSLEMSASQLVQRILSAESEIMLEKIARGRMEDHEMKQLFTKGIQRLSQAPLFIDDTAALNIFELRAKCRKLKNKHNIGMIIIDYLQLMSGTGEKGGNREQEISTISRNLKGLAKELNVPIIALSQLSREVEKRGAKDGGRIPQLSDLRESGAIEQDADMVMFLYRPDYYELTNNAEGEDQKGLTEVKIAKHRNGSLDTVKLKALLHIQKFVSWEEDPYNSLGMPGSNWRKIEDTDQTGGAKVFQVESKMNNMNTDYDFDDEMDEAPF
ncbi:MAG: replicative DNA helicase [Chitinophagaceae bacterium]|nr:MAG: replicative DNA helicase [Chitinophagaceae bacterium]